MCRVIPVGGKRRGGYQIFDFIEQAHDVARQLLGQPGFPNPRIEKGVLACGCCTRFYVRWGDDRIYKDHFPFLQSLEAEAAIGRFFGYSEQAIEKHLNNYSWLESPEGLAFVAKHGYQGSSMLDNWSPTVKAEAESLAQAYASQRRAAA